MRKDLQTLKFSFDAKSLTHFGGLFLIQRFCSKLCLRRRLERILHPSPNWADYHPADLALVFLFILIAGLPESAKPKFCTTTDCFSRWWGSNSYPTKPRCAVVCADFRPERFAAWRDCTIKCGHGSLRPGDTAANTGARGLVRRCLQKVPAQIARRRVRFLADAGFFSGRLVDDLDQAGCGYIIVCSKAKSYLPMAERAGFRELSFGWAVAEFRFRPQRWSAEHLWVPKTPWRGMAGETHRPLHAVQCSNTDQQPTSHAVVTFEERVIRPEHPASRRDLRILTYPDGLGLMPQHLRVL